MTRYVWPLASICASLLLAIMVFSSAAPVCAEDDSTMDITGYLQTQYLYDIQGAPPGAFAVRRARLSLDGHSRDRFDGKFQYAVDRLVPSIKDMYVTGYTPDLGLRVGQFKVPFSEEVLLSSSKRETLERPPIIRRLWPGERDRGVALTYRPHDKHGGQVLAGVFLGNGANNWDNNAAKDIVVRYKQFFDEGKGAAFVGYQNGQFTDGAAATTARSYIGVGGTWHDTDKDWKLYSEAHVGQALGTNFVGGFARGVRVFDGGDHSVYAQVDYMDPDTATAADVEMGPLAGYIWQAGNDTRFTVELNGRQDQATAGTDFEAGVRCQIDFD